MSSSKFQFERFEQEKQRLASLRKYEPLVSDVDPDLDKLVKIAAFICQTPISLVNLVEANQTIFKAAIGTDLKGSPREISFCAKAIAGKGIFEIADATLDERFKNNPLVTGSNQIRFYAGSPLVNKDGMNMGTLCVFDVHPKVLLPEQKEALETLGKMAVMIMENRRQSAVLQKGNLLAVLSLENKLAELTKQLEGMRKFLPLEVAAELSPNITQGESSAIVKDMVILQCSINLSKYYDESGGAAFPFLNTIYTLISKTISNYNGIVHQFDGMNVSAIFSEPLSTFPYEENALYCAFELIDEMKHLTYPNDIPSPTSITISLHSGKVLSGMVSLPTRIEYIISGKVVEESKHQRDALSAVSNSVFVSNSFFIKVKDSVEILQQHKIDGEIMLDVYEVSIKQP